MKLRASNEKNVIAGLAVFAVCLIGTGAFGHESHDLAATVVYKKGVPADGPSPKLDPADVDSAGKVIDQQRQRAGVRLTTILNDIWK